MHLLWRRDVMVRAQSEDVRDAVRGRRLCSGRARAPCVGRLCGR